MSNTTEVAYSKLTNHRGNKRIWLEGKRLGTIGFVRHATYDTIINKETKTLVLILSDNGTKKVSGRKRGEKEIPILDIGNVEITDMFKDIERIRATFKTTGVIVIEPHHEDANMVEREARLKKNLKGGTVTEGSACSGAGVFAAASHEGLLEGDIHSQVSWVVDREGKYLQVGMDNNSAITDDTVIFKPLWKS